MDQTQNECGWMNSIKVTLGSLDHREVKSFISSIASVSNKLRKHNEEAYSPKLVTIGPIHRGTSSNLLAMEEHKWRYMLALLHRTQNPVSTLDECGKIILGLDDAVRASYGGNIKYDPHELAKIMLLDGCFLLELLLKCSPQDMIPQIPREDNHHHSSLDPILGHQEMLPFVLTDLILLENQIPFFVLKTLARILLSDIFTTQVDHLVADLTLSLFGYPLIRCPAVAHFLHLMHLSSIIDEGQKVKQAQQELKRCATRLRAAGVTLRPIENHIKEVKRFGFDIRFVKGVLEIPPMYIEETSEVYLRNFIAWEQSRIGISRQFSSYAMFLRGLVCSSQDIELLISIGVLVMKDSNISNEDLLTFFVTITKGVDQMDSSYSKLCEDLNTYSEVNHLKKFPILVWHYCRLCVECIRYSCKCSYRILIHDHIPNVWKFIGIVAALVLLVLTIMQTYYSAHG
ncbi:hypothetical protein Lal_00041864 [Lupinus albus]|uniref:Uncharacterized protein n=1 Tax=Lupinus albus TaxID=3870 RepID=A0A6A5PE41_LUPAL|nr:hypothetical protein Lalb_Chr03g0043121 [Lupinus albus]KAF1895583.1 hypothetical protein Lal_00041864 [Lupinus albus]